MTAEKKVLIVDDSELTRQMLSGAFRDAGWQPVTAGNGLEAVKQCYLHAPHCIVLDNEMPVMKGNITARLLKSRREISRIPVILHTASDREQDRGWGLASGADAYFVKSPGSLSALVELAERLTAETPEPDAQLIRRDAVLADTEKILESVTNLADRELFRRTLQSSLAELISCTELNSSVSSMFELFYRAVPCEICVFILDRNGDPALFTGNSPALSDSQINDFRAICLAGFREHVPDLSLNRLKTVQLPVDAPVPSGKTGQDLSSYICVPCTGRDGRKIGSFHAGSAVDNFFTEERRELIEEYCRGCTVVLENNVTLEKAAQVNAKIRLVFSKFIPLEVIDDLLKQDHAGTLTTGEKRNVVVLFSDIRSFTKISENNSAEQVVSFLNTYFEEMVKIITAHGGTIDKFIGDAILAVFGAPTSYEDNESRAVAAALQMGSALASLAVGELVLPEGGFATGIGIHSGPAIVGNIGSKDKYDYTVIGDTVNLASRLEGLTKHYGLQLLLSQDAAKALEGNIQLLEIDNVKVKGKENPTTLYTAWNSETPLIPAEAVDLYQKGLQMYKMKNWHIAREYFEHTAEAAPGFVTAKLYIDRCTDFIAVPPPDSWDGSIAFDHK